MLFVGLDISLAKMTLRYGRGAGSPKHQKNQELRGARYGAFLGLGISRAGTECPDCGTRALGIVWANLEFQILSAFAQLE